MNRWVRLPLALIVMAVVGTSPANGSTAPALAIHRAGAWREWWHSDAAPTHWSGPDTVVTGALAWRPLADGVAWASARLACPAPAWRQRLIVVRLDPRRVRLGLEMDLAPGTGRPAWSIDRSPSDALVAVNVGQFVRSMPWGWVTIDGRQRLEPGSGPLSTALAIDSTGATHWIEGDSLASARSLVELRHAVLGFQSYPTLLRDDGRVPDALRASGRGIDVAHRDARLALGETRSGELLIVMTRFDAFGEAAAAAPMGLTTPEMAAVMGALGARDAVMLDGGISAQLRLRDPRDGRTWRWPGWRKVPLALIVRSSHVR